MSPRTGRPIKGDTPKDSRINIRLDSEEMSLLDECAQRLKSTKTEVLMRGIQLVKKELDEEGKTVYKASRMKYNIRVTEKGGERVTARRGRPKTENPVDIRTGVRLDAQTDAALDEYCKRHGVTKGEAIRQGIRLLLAQENENK